MSVHIVRIGWRRSVALCRLIALSLAAAAAMARGSRPPPSPPAPPALAPDE